MQIVIFNVGTPPFEIFKRKLPRGLKVATRKFLTKKNANDSLRILLLGTHYYCDFSSFLYNFYILYTSTRALYTKSRLTLALLKGQSPQKFRLPFFSGCSIDQDQEGSHRCFVKIFLSSV
jgi:hypothetical protein